MLLLNLIVTKMVVGVHSALSGRKCNQIGINKEKVYCPFLKEVQRLMLIIINDFNIPESFYLQALPFLVPFIFIITRWLQYCKTLHLCFRQEE